MDEPIALKSHFLWHGDASSLQKYKLGKKNGTKKK